MRDEKERYSKYRDEIIRAEQARLIRNRNASTLVKSIEQIGSPEDIEGPHQWHGPSGSKAGKRDQGQCGSYEIAISEAASKYGIRQLRGNHTWNQDCETDIPESVQYEKRSESFCAFSLSDRRPNVMRGENAPGHKPECYANAPYQRDRHSSTFFAGSQSLAASRHSESQILDDRGCLRDSGKFPETLFEPGKWQPGSCLVLIAARCWRPLL
jgi:hypothetical protein